MTQDAKDFAKQVKEEILKIVKEKAKKRNGCFAGSVTMDLDKEKMLTALEIWNDYIPMVLIEYAIPFGKHVKIKSNKE